MPEIPKVKFNNGKEIPILGLGTWKSKPGEVAQAVKDAIDAGYRHFDCATAYQNQKEVGKGVADKIAEGVVKREDLFITSKLWNTFHRPELVRDALKATLEDLGLEYIDLYLIHWPMGFKEGNEIFPQGPNGVEVSDVDYIDTWREMEKLYKDGFAKSIGVSNFNSKQLIRLHENSTVVPVTNQVECHPWFHQKKLTEFCKARGITITAYSPLGSPDGPGSGPNTKKLLDDPTLKEIADKYNKTPAQIALKFQTQRSNIVIPKSVTKKRIIENIDIFDFELSPGDLEVLNSLDTNTRIVTFDLAKKHKYYPFDEEF